MPSLGTAAVLERRLAAEAGRLVPAVGVGAFGTGAFLLRVAEVVVVEVGAGVGRLEVDAALDTEFGRALDMLGLVVVVAGCMDGRQTQKMESKGVTKA